MNLSGAIIAAVLIVGGTATIVSGHGDYSASFFVIGWLLYMFGALGVAFLIGLTVRPPSWWTTEHRIGPRYATNQAFQAHKEKVFAELEREEKEFMAYLDKLREKQEREEFADFKGERTK